MVGKELKTLDDVGLACGILRQGIIIQSDHAKSSKDMSRDKRRKNLT